MGKMEIHFENSNEAEEILELGGWSKQSGQLVPNVQIISLYKINLTRVLCQLPTYLEPKGKLSLANHNVHYRR